VRRRRLSGETLNVDGLKAAYEKAIGRPTCNSTINNVALHGRRRLLLRPFHSRRDMAVTILKRPLPRRRDEGGSGRRPHRGRRLRVMFAYEAASQLSCK
jgi:hypothetical protein